MSTSNDLPEGAHLASAFVLLALCTTLLWPDAADARRAIRVDPGDGQWEQGGDAGNGAPQSLPFAFTILGARVDTVCIGNDGVATFGWGTCAPFSGSAADVAANGLGSIGTAVIAPLISHAAAAGISRSVQFN